MTALIEAPGPHQALRQGRGPARPRPHAFPAGDRSPSSVPTAPARPPSSGRSPPSCVPTAAVAGVGGHDVVHEPDRPATDRPGRPVRRGRGDDDRPREPGHGGPPLRRRGTAGPGRRHAGAAVDLTDAADRQVRTTRAACAGASTSGPAWSAPRGSSCWTSRPPDSTPAAASRCGTPSRALGAAGTDIVLDHPVPRRGRSSGRPDGDHRRWPGHRRGDTGRAQVAASVRP